MGTKYKETPIGRIPKDWKVVRLSNIIKFLTGNAFSSEYFSEEGLPLIRIRDLGKGDTETNYNGTYDEKYFVEKDDILVSMDGEFNVYLWKGPTGLLNQRVMKIWPENKNQLDDLYLFYALQKPLKLFERQIGLTTVKHLLKSHLRLIRIPLPPLPEQQKIAEILSTIDDAIQNVDEAIARTERLKKVLMQELLTKGIGHEEFKDTEIGRIPKEWEVAELKDVVKREDDIVAGPFGSNLKVIDYREQGAPIIRLQNIDYNQFINKDIKYISHEKAEELKYHSFEAGDIVLAKLGDPIGKTCIVPEYLRKGIVVADVVRIRIPSYKANKEFITYVLNSYIYRQQLEKATIGSTRPRVNITHIRKLKIPYPKLSEQQKIAEILSTIDRKLELERQRKEKHEKIKRGLMHELLTGRKRVEVEA